MTPFTSQYIAERHRIITAAIEMNRLRYYKAWRPIVQPQIELIPEHIAGLTQESLDALLLVDNVNWLCKIQAAQRYGFDKLSPYFPYGIFNLTTDPSVLSQLPPKDFFDGVGFQVPIVAYTGRYIAAGGARTYRFGTNSGVKVRVDAVNLSPVNFNRTKWVVFGNGVVHEIAHCMDFRGKFPKKAVDDLHAWFSARFLANEKAMLDNVRALWADAMKKLQDAPVSEIVPVSFPYNRYLDLLGTVKFCPMVDPAFSTKHYFQGHERSYFVKNSSNRRREFVADCVDMVWDTKSADVMAALDPELYEKAKEVFLGYWRK